jgi:hypothetical protein
MVLVQGPRDIYNVLLAGRDLREHRVSHGERRGAHIFIFLFCDSVAQVGLELGHIPASGF